MENYGLLVTFLLALLTATVYFVIAWEVVAKKGGDKMRTRALAVAFSMFWFLVGLAVFLVGLRSLFAFLGLVYWDKIVFYAVMLPVALWVAPLIYAVVYLFSGRNDVSLATSLVFACIGIAYVFLVHRYGVERYFLSFWASEWVIRSIIARQIYVFFLFIPAVVASITLGMMATLVESGEAKYRMCLISCSCFLFFILSMLDAIGIFAGLALFANRLGVLLATLLAYFAYFPPRILREKYGLGPLSSGLG